MYILECEGTVLDAEDYVNVGKLLSQPHRNFALL